VVEYLRVFGHVGFFAFGFFGFRSREMVVTASGTSIMDKSNSTMAQQIAQTASVFEQQRTGHVPGSVTVVLSGRTLVITLHGALSPAEKAVAKSPAGAAQVQEFHRQLFASASAPLRQEIERITGVEVRETTADDGAIRDAVMKRFPTGTMVQVFLLDHSVPANAWSGSASSRERVCA
jgi:uncharacterized protein YbcI